MDDEYLNDYNKILSLIAEERVGNFAVMAATTFSKQETVTNLYNKIKLTESSGKKVGFPWTNFFLFLPRLFVNWIYVFYYSIRFKVKHIPTDAIYFRTWLVPRSFSGKTLSDDYFRELITDLDSTKNVVTGYTPLDRKILKNLSTVKIRNSQIISHGLLNIKDVFSLFFDYLFTALIQVKNKYYFKNIDITKHVNRSLLNDYFCLNSFEAYIEKYRCKKLLEYKIKTFIYVYENQSWEKVCCKILGESGVRLVGYQSSGFSKVFLNFFPTNIDVKSQLMPNILLTVGDNFSNYLKENGCYNIPIETFAALRFSYPHENNRYLISSPNLNIIGRILYAFPVQFEQYIPTIHDLIYVFKGSDIQVDLKLHPLYQLDYLNDTLQLPKNFKVVNEINIETLSNKYDCVLFNDNSFGIEALIKGVKSYQYSSDGSFKDDRFIYFNLWKVNYNLDDIFSLKELIQNKKYDKSFLVDDVSKYINSMYRPYTKKAFNHFVSLI
jgi:hypothetical protein